MGSPELLSPPPTQFRRFRRFSRLLSGQPYDPACLDVCRGFAEQWLPLQRPVLASLIRRQQLVTLLARRNRSSFKPAHGHESPLSSPSFGMTERHTYSVESGTLFRPLSIRIENRMYSKSLSCDGIPRQRNSSSEMSMPLADNKLSSSNDSVPDTYLGRAFLCLNY